jgi:hypothetical protein
MGRYRMVYMSEIRTEHQTWWGALAAKSCTKTVTLHSLLRFRIRIR